MLALNTLIEVNLDLRIKPLTETPRGGLLNMGDSGRGGLELGDIKVIGAYSVVY